MKRNERATRFIVTALVLGTTASAASCLRVNDEHCMFNGGDTACGSDRYCVAAVKGGSVSAVSDGCTKEEMVLDERPTAQTGIARPKYGLVESQEELEARLGRSIQGCSAWPPADLAGLLAAVEGIELDLRSRERASRSAAALTVAQGDAINALVRAVQSAEEQCGGDTTTGTTTTVEETTTTAETETDGESSTTGPMPCMSDEDCSGDAPFCNLEDPEMGMCVACDGMPDPHAACAGMNAETPVCLEGVCVQCTTAMPEACTGLTPVCDAATNVCVPCIAHEECGEAACNLFTGECLPDDQVVHVGGDSMVDVPNFETIGEAVASFDDGTQGTIIVHAGASYDESVTVNGNRVLAFLAAEIGMDAEPPRWVRTMGNAPQLVVNANSTVLLDGMQLSDNGSGSPTGLRIDSGRLWVDRGRIVNNAGGGIDVRPDAELMLRNCFVGGDRSDVHVLEVSGATVTVLYSTLVAGFGIATALMCDDASTVTVRNSLLVSRSTDSEIVCAGTIEHNAAEAPLGGTNTDLVDMNTAWFVNHTDGDFHLAPLAPVTIDTAARWRLGDPPTDIDGDPRPMNDDTSDVAGADVP